MTLSGFAAAPIPKYVTPAKDWKASVRIPGTPSPSPESEVIDWKATYEKEKKEDTDKIAELQGQVNKGSALLSFAEGKIVALATTLENQHRASIHYTNQSRSVSKIIDKLMKHNNMWKALETVLTEEDMGFLQGNTNFRHGQAKHVDDGMERLTSLCPGMIKAFEHTDAVTQTEELKQWIAAEGGPPAWPKIRDEEDVELDAHGGKKGE